jgi:simple sugar transport system ATP-binding protein
VLRKGRVVGTREASEVDEHELARMMVGREVIFRIKRPSKKADGNTVLKTEGIWVMGDQGLHAVKGVSLEIRSGEILGIAGVSGNGQKEFAGALIGVRRVTKGRVYINGLDVTNKSPSDILSLGVAYIPEDREEVGYFRDASIRDNLVFKTRYNFLVRSLFLNYDGMNRFADDIIREYGIDTPSRSLPAKNLSGGNRQKLVIARELAINPKLLIVNQPTRGLDVGATEYVRRKIIEQRNKGVAILLISEDLEEVLMLSDRVAVFYEGEVMGIVNPEKTSVEEIGLMMAGVRRMEF